MAQTKKTQRERGGGSGGSTCTHWGFWGTPKNPEGVGAKPDEKTRTRNLRNWGFMSDVPSPGARVLGPPGTALASWDPWILFLDLFAIFGLNAYKGQIIKKL